MNIAVRDPQKQYVMPQCDNAVDEIAGQMAVGLKGRRASYEKGSGIMVIADKAGVEFKVEITRLR